MKMISLLLSLASVSPAMAIAADSGRPVEVTCEVLNQTKSFPKTIHIQRLNTDAPSSDLPDSGLMEKIDPLQTTTPGLISIRFSNGCDNYYEFNFEEKRLADLNLKKVNFIVAQLKGYNDDYMSEMIEKYDADFTDELGETSPIICRLK